MPLSFPAPLQPGDTIGVTSPASGVGDVGRARLAFAVEWLRGRGYEVVVGDCMAADRWVSAPKAERAAELQAMLTDPGIRAVVPPWGGAGTALDILDQLDFDAIRAAEPTWVVGFSDSSSWMVSLTLRAGLPTLHGDNLMDTPYAAPEPLAHWLEIATAVGPVAQHASGMIADWHPLTEPAATTWKQRATGNWRLHGAQALDVSGTVIGGCTEMMAGLAGTPYGDVPSFADEHGDLIVYLETAEEPAFTVCRYLHQLRYAGWFDHASAILIARTDAPASHDDGGLSQEEAALDALGGLGIPIVFDMEIGHVPPHLPLLNGASARIRVDGARREIVQAWPQPA